MKRILAFSFALFMALTLTPYVNAAGIRITDNQNGTIAVSSLDGMNGTIKYFLYKDAELVFSGEQPINGTSVQIGFPVRSLPRGSYEVTAAYYNAAAAKQAEATDSITMGVENPTVTGGEGYSTEPIATMRAVMIPYAKVYASSSLTGEPVVELKRHDLVRVISASNGVAHVKYHIQSGNGHIENVDNVNANYVSEDDLIGTGYMKLSAFKLPTSQYTDLSREVVEVAYTRLGTKGVYSQAKRFMDYYLDCSAFASWCWYQAGVDISANGTNCNGLANWARAHSGSIIWEAEEDDTEVKAEVAAFKLANGILTSILFDGGIPEDDATDYVTHLTEEVYAQMKPGDLVFFNHREKLSYNGAVVGSYPVNEHGINQGYDHVAIFAGLQNESTAIILESSSPSTDPGKNTKISQMPLGGEKANTVCLIVRPHE